MTGHPSMMSCFREMEYKDMEKQVWKPKIEKLINVIQDDPDGWRKLLELYNPDTRPKKREERYIQFKSLDLNTKWNVSEDFFSQGWFGLDQMMINITTPGFKKKGVAIKENKLEYLEKLWLFSTKEADKKIKIELENQRNIEIEERRDAGTKIFARTFIIIIFLAVAFTVKSCVDSIDEENSNHPACKKLGLKSNWNNTKCY